MENDKPFTWNAGAEFNNLVGFIKFNYFQYSNVDNPITLLDILSNDLDFTFTKIKIESINKKNDVTKDLEKLRNDINNLYSEIQKYMSNGSKGKWLLKERLLDIKRRLWDLQGEFGVLFPITEKRISPHEAIRQF